VSSKYNNRRSRLIASGVAVAALGGSAFLAPAASAAPVVGPSSNVTGEAGLYVEHWDNWHLRDAHATFKITAAMMHLNNALDSSYPGATGVELCDDDDNVAAQLGVTFLGGQFEVLGAYGDLTENATGSDPCSQDGVIVTDPGSTNLRSGSAVQLAGAELGASATGVNSIATGSDPDTYVFTGNQVQPSVDETSLVVGDTVTLDAYYSPAGKRHFIQYTVDIYNTSGTFVKELQYTERVNAENFFEAAIGADNTNAPNLTAPADLPLVTFSNATFDNYNGSIRNRLIGGELLVQANTINGASQITMEPSAITGNSFSINEGSASS
jgi:hypothetical protein